MTDKSFLFPKAIRSARDRRKWTQVELAGRLGVTQGTVSFWERGIESPSLEHQVKLVTLMPEIFEDLAEQETVILSRLYQLERAVYSGKCSCSGCGCGG
ncbi:MAG TPA: helix-turn-helix transcriptional regulator [Anaerolineales bacterium]|nr:helix-turn-helix transcriptional regulator [Anaerolineales bacterium]